MHLSVRGLPLKAHEALRTSIERRLRFVLGRFASRIGRVTVEVDLATQAILDRSMVKRCRITVNLDRDYSLSTEDNGSDVAAVVERATRRAGEIVRREMDRQREGSRRPATPP
jgi:ribosome-associated translation inhibitor RaiA